MVDMIASKGFRYRGRALRPDDEFSPSRAHGRVLFATGRATYAELGTVQTPTPRIRTKAVKPSGTAPASFPSLKGKTKRQLLSIAKREQVLVPEDATNDVIAQTIEAKRAATGAA